MSEENINTDKTTETNINSENIQTSKQTDIKTNENAKITDETDINKLITELEKDMLKAKENNYKEFKAKFDAEYNNKFKDKDKEIAALKEKIEQIDASYKEATKDVMDKYKEEIKAKFDSIENELSTRKSAVAKSDNPFRKENSKFEGDWFENPNISEEDKGKMFAQYISNNR